MDNLRTGDHQKQMARCKLTEGQSLLEIVVAVGVVVMLVTGLVVAATSALRFNQAARTRSQAVKLTQEGIELTRDLRNRSWAAFEAYADPSGKLWCLSQDGTWSAADGSCPVNIDNFFTRSVELVSDSNRIVVTALVSWPEGGSQRSTQLSTYFTQWR